MMIAPLIRPVQNMGPESLRNFSPSPVFNGRPVSGGPVMPPPGLFNKKPMPVMPPKSIDYGRPEQKGPFQNQPMGGGLLGGMAGAIGGAPIQATNSRGAGRPAPTPQQGLGGLFGGSFGPLSGGFGKGIMGGGGMGSYLRNGAAPPLAKYLEQRQQPMQRNPFGGRIGMPNPFSRPQQPAYNPRAFNPVQMQRMQQQFNPFQQRPMMPQQMMGARNPYMRQQMPQQMMQRPMFNPYMMQRPMFNPYQQRPQMSPFMGQLGMNYGMRM